MFSLDAAPVCHSVARAWRFGWRRAVPSLATLLGLAAMIAAPAASGRSRVRARRVRSCTRANTRPGAAPVRELRAAVVCLINTQRASHHLRALRASRRLDRSAQAWTNEMVASREFSHGSDFAARITAVGFVWSTAGENIATGFATPRQVVNAWMASTGHCQNILSPAYTEVGTGVSRGRVRRFARGPATWTQDFARPLGQTAPSGNWGPANGCPY